MKKNLENEKQNEKNIPDWFLREEQAPNKKQIKKLYNPKTLKQIARENFIKDDKELYDELAKKCLIHIFLLMKIKKKVSK